MNDKKAEENPKCKKCGSVNSYKRGTTYSNKQRYTCRDCGHTYSEGEDGRKTKSGVPGKPCTKCGVKCVIKFGMDSGNKQRYRCKKCGYVFTKYEI